MVMYYDWFTDEYVDVIKEAIAPPERYLPTIRGTDAFVETWDIGDGKKLDVTYANKEDSPRIRKAQEDRYNCKLNRLISWTIPSELFDKYANMFGITVGENYEN